MQFYEWANVPSEEMNPKFFRRVIHTENMTIARIHLKQGAIVPEHHHINEQVALVLSGAIKFIIAGEEQELRAGQTVVIPPNVPHMVEVIDDSDIIDTFAPRREDWIAGDDAYMRK
jgi:quercetin dioxygenase-like cupin family protein